MPILARRTVRPAHGRVFLVLGALTVLVSPALAPSTGHARSGTPPATSTHPAAADLPAPLAGAAALLGVILRDNDEFVRHHQAVYFDRFREEQHPRATMVACADSRFHDQAIDATPDGDIFEIRNIGNQIDATAGSVEYGVRHLHTPLLLVVGHVGCGAVRSAMEDYSREPRTIRRELDGLHLSIFLTRAQGSPAERWLANVIGNVHVQVSEALAEYGDLVRAGQLVVVGAVYDFRNDLKLGRGRLVVVNVNGETDPKRLAATPLLQAATRAAPPQPIRR